MKRRSFLTAALALLPVPWFRSREPQELDSGFCEAKHSLDGPPITCECGTVYSPTDVVGTLLCTQAEFSRITIHIRPEFYEWTDNGWQPLE